VAAPADTPSSTSREHEIIREPDGVITVAGGKLTTFRRMAEQVVDVVVEQLRDRGVERPFGRCMTRSRPLPGSGDAPPALSEHELGADVERHLHEAYGAASAAVVAEIDGAPDLGHRIEPDLPYLWAEVVHGARQEHVREVEDALARRIPLLREARDQGLGAAERAGELIGRVLGWSPQRRAASVDRYRAAVAVTRLWKKDPGRVL
jgi:glycerol-3-phosphate dehydrogenase